MALEERLKQRMIGGAVLVALVVIFVPMMIDEPRETKLIRDHEIPQKPTALIKPTPEILPPEPKPQTKQVEIPKPPPKPVAKVEQKAPSKSVERKSPTSWMLQVASLTVKKNAEKLVADLKKADMPAHLERVSVEGKQHFRIRVGPVVGLKTAEKMAKNIKSGFKLSPKVLRYPE
jgi:DedD protein